MPELRPTTTMRPADAPAQRPTRQAARVAAKLLPGAPTAVTVTAATGSASVAFIAPVADGGSPVTGYQVTASSGQTATGAASPIVCPATVGVRTFTVRALNAAGYGPASSASAAATIL